MFDKKEKEEILKIVHSELHNTTLDIIMFFIMFVLIVSCIIYIAYVCRHNSDVDYRNKQLEFCDGIYKSDNVILDQCKDYFVILESGDN